MAKSHDHLFRAIFSDPEHAAPLLRSALPPALADRIDWRTLERHGTVHDRREQRTTVCDVLFAARLRGGGELLLYLVLEHKSKGHRFDALQLLEQIVGVLRTHLREHPGPRHLPPVLPVLLHAGQHRWNSPTEFRDLFDLERLPPALLPYLPSFTYLLDDLYEKPPEQLRARTLDVFGLCALALLQHLRPAARDAAAFAHFANSWGDVLDRAARATQARSADDSFALLVDYLLDNTDLRNEEVHAVLRNHLTDDTMKKFVSTRTQIRNEGKAEGIAEGKAEGKAEGIAVGKAEGKAEGEAVGRSKVLLRQLQRRFGPLDDTIAERVRAATSDELDRWADRVLDAPTLAGVFAEDC